MLVRDVMTTEVISVFPEERIDRIASILTEKKIHGVPVVESGVLVGIITETDFFIKDSFNLHLPSYINFIKKTKFSGKINSEEKDKIKELINSTAADIMTKECITVSPEDDIEKVLNLIKERNLHIIPVVNSEGKMEGIIARSDLIRMIKV
ncbi:MAG: CBS domain-containing protein [Candidatus Moranbacteria bacterium]|jgi:CBS domain-containing protein|nr:CBS domain-containing protein [Candidatus Moranbacteria bacterium]